jgi:Ca-activated chloride channel family protein
MMFRFADPWLLLGLIIPVIVLWWTPARGGRAFAPFALAAIALRPSRGPLLFRVLLAAGLAALVVAAARPQYGQTITEREQAGRDLVLVIDLSGSMQIDDLADAKGERIDRLAAVFSSARTFIDGRPDDRIGLVFFGDKALTSCPLTYDHETVRQFLDRTQEQQRALWNRGADSGLLGGSTNLGLGLGTALKALRDPKSLGRAVILITDGVDTRQLRNWVDPLLAARQAARLDVSVYGIGVGNPSGNRTVDGGFGRRMLVPISGDLLPDLGRLQAITSLANGQAFTASDIPALKEVFGKIDRLQPTPRTVRQRDDFSDRSSWPLALGAALLALALLLEPRLRGIA